MGIVDEERTLLFSIIEHCFAKKELKRLAFLPKSVTNLLSGKTGGMQGTFLSLNLVKIRSIHGELIFKI